LKRLKVTGCAFFLGSDWFDRLTAPGDKMDFKVALEDGLKETFANFRKATEHTDFAVLS
jgi:hypothetical protein